MSRRQLLAATGAAATLSACRGLPVPAAGTAPADGSHLLAGFWFDELSRLARETITTPPVVARAAAYAGVAVYEASLSGKAGWGSLSGRLRGLGDLPARPEGADPATVLAATFEPLVPALFPVLDPMSTSAQRRNVAAYLRENGTRGTEDDRRYGRALGQALVDWARTDGAPGQEWAVPTQLRREEQVVEAAYDGGGTWVPTAADFRLPMHPRWGQNRTLVLATPEEVDPGPPTPYSEDPDSQYIRELREVYEAALDMTDEEAAICLYWQDPPGQTPTPGGHWLAILGQVLAAEGASLERAAEAYLLLGLALGDAFVCCWHTKYRYDYVRPITVIRKLWDPRWYTAVPTPPFPEYTSGHSCGSGAAARVLTALFGEGYAFTDHSLADLALFPARSFHSFDQAAREAAASRLYAGIHYRFSNDRGLVQGRRVGEAVLRLELRST